MAGFDIWLGGTKLERFDWRANEAYADDDNNDPEQASPETIAFLGFDPFADNDNDEEEVHLHAPETAAAKARALKRLPTKARAAQHAVNVRQRDAGLNRTRAGMKFLHKTEEVGGQPAEMKVFAVKGGSIYYDEPEARKPGFYCDPNYFFAKVFKEWVK